MSTRSGTTWETQIVKLVQLGDTATLHHCIGARDHLFNNNSFDLQILAKSYFDLWRKKGSRNDNDYGNRSKLMWVIRPKLFWKDCNWDLFNEESKEISLWVVLEKWNLLKTAMDGDVN